MVFQNVYLFPDTIENNIKFGCPNATHEDVVKAAKAARCHDFISALPEGYQTVIGESGATISGGEKQRISIARAIMKDAPIIILDEATANVDPENEAELQRAIEALTQGKTIIMIAHRLKTVKNADQIIVIDRGKISQQGTHDELIKQAGIYADFVGMREKSYRLENQGRQPCIKERSSYNGQEKIERKRLYQHWYLYCHLLCDVLYHRYAGLHPYLCSYHSNGVGNTGRHPVHAVPDKDRKIWCSNYYGYAGQRPLLSDGTKLDFDSVWNRIRFSC